MRNPESVIRLPVTTTSASFGVNVSRLRNRMAVFGWFDGHDATRGVAPAFGGGWAASKACVLLFATDSQGCHGLWGNAALLIKQLLSKDFHNPNGERVPPQISQTSRVPCDAMMRLDESESSMAGVSPHDAAAKQLADMSQRVAMQIAELPFEERREGFASAKRGLREAARELGIAGRKMDGLIEILMKGMRQMVLGLDVGGKPQGGHA
jgi:hypothetical protein